MNPNYPLVAERARYRCEYCQAPEAIFNLSFEVEHIVPRSKNGEDNEANWALACRACNLYKSNQLEGLDDVTNRVARLFNPRQDIWTNHIRVDLESGAMVGVTAIGRVTISLLQMNRPNQMAARRRGMLLRLFP
jgi:HNH endonuclease